jgi:hypothetical protein
MNKSFSLVLAISVLSTMGYAQANLDNEVDSELNKMYSVQATKTEVKPVTIEAAQPADVPAAQTAVSGQPIYILNQATPTATSQSTSSAAAVQKQPTTVIEASPLTESRAESLRKVRQDAETSTEAKIVEKLEQSRLEDEKRRAQVLFGNKLDQSASAEAAPQAPVAAPVAPAQAPAPQIYIIPQQVAPAAPEKAAEKKEEVKVEAKAEPKVEKEIEAADKVEAEMSVAMEVPAPTSKKYFSSMIGVPVVDGSNNIQGNYALGFTFGNKYDDSFAVEGTFIFANYESKNVNNYWNYGYLDTFDVNQYSGAIATKWYMLKGMVKPVIGGVAQYSYREFNWSDKNYVRPYNLGKSESHAVDIGGIIGVEVEFNPSMTVGLDARYMKNLVVRRNYSTDNLNNNYYQNSVNSQYGYRTPIEDLDYYTISLSARVTF